MIGAMARFQCLGCSRCCRGLIVPVTRFDVARWLCGGRPEIAACIVRVEDFEGVGSRVVYALPRRDDGTCIFLEGNRCSIYEVKPLVCELFPYAYSSKHDKLGLHPWALKNCEAVLRGMTELDSVQAAELLAKARLVFSELRRVEELAEDYERMRSWALERVRQSRSST